MTSEPGALELARVVELLAPALSQGRRRKGQLVSGGSRAFFTSKSCATVYVPFPLPVVEAAGVSPVRLASCGLALQSCPTKEALAALPLADLRPIERAALSLVEGPLAMAWAIGRFPGLERELRLARATATWDALVAERVPPAVGACRLVALEPGRLVVEADEPIVASELRLRALELLAAFASAPGGAPAEGAPG